MYRHHNFEERLNIISRLISGESLRAICREEGLDKHMVANGIYCCKEDTDSIEVTSI